MVNVAVIGAAGGIGQSLSLLLLRELPFGSTLSLYDVVGAPGVAADLSHIDRAGITVKHAAGKLPPVPRDPALTELAEGVDVFVIVAGVPRKPGMTRDDLFNVNAGIVMDLVLTCASVSPNACFCIVTNPVNSTTPIAAQTLRKIGVYNKNKLLGVSLLDGLRATRFINNARHPLVVPYVPVVGGHSDVTIVPLYSQIPGPLPDESTLKEIRKRVQVAGTEVVKAKAGRGSATLSMAEAGARFTMHVVKALMGLDTPMVYAYVDTDGEHECPFLAMPVVLGKNGIERRLPIGPITTVEKEMLEEAVGVVKKNIAKGETFARSKL
ncbi:putative glycosomal malate dehydrogenase [Trypanosoma cruzi]|uniref:malate dehydrogenase n=2 Tax=Trypanosoma cruzi TaxID=5693 RepID=Q4DRD8_TRYCC|nr:glycosomal malate dehydrogenase, putative [Trypanosoma cruzi]7NRZ_A Chain A, Malate dehydrogenase [Trypanosoma cruzi strain CL Brener]7NRZ_B Chain B, Malate dehydrogenase [Trypanosoma cruzi strain CL Brener]7NRZ_C Chain C, Malate dehydrogenase [Trypanosoma cruzi strain CL Brener]7NRZ_D Chain D, Malate dehydrogenase [Trypanosoma cruzi strain CL Brener]7NRZ_E Chain E, Malate dehydrogenase [Trypanosoma cruzi strain CL Brener]7NRZ_F Chain F, Malate dehydrogenase [Trypanosoma cruzi strain CL Br|eukprot:XP_816948.1 glycosomal malate dehydrogenase [Trypanosoma cruzi strain CL Brener]